MVPPKKLTLETINEHLTCRLCSGYLIDAWTINECLHSFCRPCIFSYFADPDENTACPVCATVPHPGNPLLGITKDCWLQQIVYKLVPSLFKREMCQRRIYYDSNPESKQQLLEQYTKTHASQMGCREEELGELSERCLFQQKDKLNDKESIYVTLEYHQTHERCFLECSSNMPINILKQYLKKVLPLSKRARYQIDVLHEQKVLLDNLTLNHIHAWKANSQAEKRKQLYLFYRVIVIEREEAEPDEMDTTILQPVTNTIEPKPPAFIRSASVYDQQNPSTFVHTTPFIPAEAKTISLNNTITEQLHGHETVELIKPKECTMLDCKTMTITTPFSYSMSPLGEMSKPKKRTKKSTGNDSSAAKKCKVEKKSKKKIKEEHNLTPIVPCNPSVTPSENENPHEIVEQKHLSYSEVIQEANKLLAADEPMTPVNPPSIAPAPVTPLTNPTTTRLTKPIATVSPLHTSKNNHNRVIEQVDEDQLMDLSKPTLAPADVPLKSETKKRSRQGSSSTTRTKVSRNSNKSSNDEGNNLSKSLKKTHSSQLLHAPPLPPPPPTPSATPAQQQMFQNLFHSFQNQANYWPMSPWPVPPSLALMADPRNYYAQAWAAPPHHAPPPPPQPSALHGPKDLSSASLNDFIHEPSNSVFSLPPSAALLNPGSNFSRTPSSSSLHLHHASNRHRPTPLNGTLS